MRINKYANKNRGFIYLNKNKKVAKVSPSLNTKLVTICNRPLEGRKDA